MLTNILLRSMAGIYFLAFASFYPQIPGLIGFDGILPVRTFQEQVKETTNVRDPAILTQILPSILWFADDLNGYILEVFPQLTQFDAIDNLLHISTLCGVVLAFWMMIQLPKVALNSINFAILWVLYMSLCTMSSVFMQYQWDALLLEAGFITIFLAPLFPWIKNGSIHAMVKAYMQWLCFRLMVASGLVKLLSGCPTWWGLTALNYHFQTQPLPNAISWFMHQLPDWILAMGTLDTFVVEIIMPLLFFMPIRSLRIFAGIRVHILMFMIMMTGNYNFFNLLTMVINLANFDDQFLAYVLPKGLWRIFGIPAYCKGKKRDISSWVIDTVLPVGLVIAFTVYFEYWFLTSPDMLTLEDLFSLEDLKEFLTTSEHLKFVIMYIFIYIIVWGVMKNLSKKLP